MLAVPSGPSRQRKGEPDVSSFTFTLEQVDGTPATPAVLHSAVPDWRPGHTIALGQAGVLRVIAVKPPKVDGGEPVLIVEAA